MAGKQRGGLTPREQAFVAEYLLDLNQGLAAKRMGERFGIKYAHPEVIGSKLMDKAEVRAAIQAGMDRRSKRTEITADYVLNTIFQTIERCKQAEPVLDKLGNPTGEYMFDSKAVLKGAELLGKHLKLFTEKHEIGFTKLEDLTDDQLSMLASRLNIPVVSIASGGRA
jgi:phage terminase small subunit